jgi:hypothetical protein
MRTICATTNHFLCFAIAITRLTSPRAVTIQKNAKQSNDSINKLTHNQQTNKQAESTQTTYDKQTNVRQHDICEPAMLDPGDVP